MLLLFFITNCPAQIGYEDAFPALRFNYPVEIQHAADGTDRLFVVEQPGIIRVFENNPSVSAAPTFLDIRDKVRYSSGQELGLLGLAFHPDYAENGHFFVYYTRDSGASGSGAEMVLARYSVNGTDPDAANADSELILFSFGKNQNDSNHNGGKIAFGPDGYLYVSIGDGGGAGDPSGNGQDLNTVFGSILRIDVDLDGSNPLENNPALPDGNYEIPVTNPRVGQGGLDELYAWGIRNTWKFSFDPPTNRMWGADVGQDNFEEINLITNGGNFGWNRFEATSLEDGGTGLITSPDIKPVYFYDHSNGDVSITGGYVYRGASDNPSLQGRYVYGDYVSGRVWSLNYNASSNTATSEFLFRTNGQSISSFGLDEAGELYFSGYGSSAGLYKIVGGNTGPVTVPVNGQGNWISLQGETNGPVQALATIDSGIIYVGGTFTQVASNTVSNLAMYDPATGWSAFGSGTNGPVSAIAIAQDGTIYVGGDFTQIDGQAVSNIAMWDGSSWAALEGGTNGPVDKIGISNTGQVYAGGAFETAGGIPVNNIAMWTGSMWTALTDSGTGISGTNNEIRAIAFDEDNQLYVGGNFDTAGGISAARIATWNGSNWGTLGGGTSGFVQAIAITPISIYVGGNFSTAGGITVNRMARWNRGPQTWQALGQGLSGNVNSLLHDGNYLYAGGSFQTASDVVNLNKIVNNVARWNDAQGWQALGPGTSVGVNSPVNSLVFSQGGGNLYAGGSFSSAGPISASNLAVWGISLQDSDADGVADDSDDCPNTPPDTLVDNRGCEVTAIPANNFRIAVTGSSCSGVDNGRIGLTAENTSLNYTITISGNGVNEAYAFSSSLNIDNLAAGSYDLCIRVDGLADYEYCSKAVVRDPAPLEVTSVLDMATNMLTLKLSGSSNYTVTLNDLPVRITEDEYSILLQQPTNRIEVSTDAACQGTHEEVVLLRNKPLVFPNPFEDALTVKLDGGEQPYSHLAIYDLNGRRVYFRTQLAGEEWLHIDTSELPGGMYVLKFQGIKKVYSCKIVKR